jgi:hypothetical protein
MYVKNMLTDKIAMGFLALDAVLICHNTDELNQRLGNATSSRERFFEIFSNFDLPETAREGSFEGSTPRITHPLIP